jgi:hypothetical protein
MKPIDYLKALGVAVAVLALNLLLTTVVITVYSMLIDPGQPQSHYTAMAPRIGAWSGPAGGIVLMFLAGWFFGQRRPERNALAFIGVVWACYLALDVALGLAAAPASALFTPNFALSLGGAAAAGLVGAGQARRKT